MKKEFSKKISGERVRKARESSGLTQDELAKSIGKSRPYVSLVESGGSGFTPDLLFRLSVILNVSSDYILGLTDKPSEQFSGMLRSVDPNHLTAEEIALFRQWIKPSE